MQAENFRFRGKPLDQLSKEELLEALVKALNYAAQLDRQFLPSNFR